MQWNTPSHRPDIMDAYTLQLAENERTGMELVTHVSDWSMQLLEAKKNGWKSYSRKCLDLSAGKYIKILMGLKQNPFEEVVRDWTPLQKHTASISWRNSKKPLLFVFGISASRGNV